MSGREAGDEWGGSALGGAEGPEPGVELELEALLDL